MTQSSGSLSNAEEIDMKMMFFSHDLNVVINKPNHQNKVRKYVVSCKTTDKFIKAQKPLGQGQKNMIWLKKVHGRRLSDWLFGRYKKPLEMSGGKWKMTYGADHHLHKQRWSYTLYFDAATGQNCEEILCFTAL